MNKKVFLYIILLVGLVACRSSAAEPDAVEPLPTLAVIDDSPRVVETPDPGLPPTWTPQATVDGGHIYSQGEGGQAAVSGTRFLYTVQRGDTLGKIATQYGVSVADLARINNIQNVNVIKVGQQLIIPLPPTGE
ncbi:MAG: LysM peptidoglycan-binding domain-containing protein [Anaerolinea sp.]|nr:LysM peptidoglycan-binding domain-containing protein [Anaerolinea sp.]